MRDIEFGGSQASTSRASPSWMRMVLRPKVSILPSRLATPLMKGSQPMKPAWRMMLGLPHKMLARAEADLEPDLVDGLREQARERGGGRLPQRKAQSRQQLVEQAVFPLAQRPRLPPAIGPETVVSVMADPLDLTTSSCPALCRASTIVFA